MFKPNPVRRPLYYVAPGVVHRLDPADVQAWLRHGVTAGRVVAADTAQQATQIFARLAKLSNPPNEVDPPT